MAHYQVLTSFFYRCFTFGIGSGASTALVEGLARAGNGTAELVKEGERMQPKVCNNSFYVWIYYYYIHPPRCFLNTGNIQSETCSTASHHRCICVASSSKGIRSVTMPMQASTYIQWREIGCVCCSQISKEGSIKKMDCTQGRAWYITRDI